MLKGILKLNGAQELKKGEQKVIKGGWPIGIQPHPCNSSIPCESNAECGVGRCQIPVGQISGCCLVFKL